MMNLRLIFTTFFIALFSNIQAIAQKPAANVKRTLIIMFDGLRPDYITKEQMPNLYKLKQEGIYATDNHSVFPTVTRVNSASYATGSYPQQHGLLGNTVYFPQVDSLRGLNTGDAANLMKINEATGGKLLQSVSLGEVLKSQGKRMMVFSSGSSGQAYLQNHKVNGGAIINPELILPESLKEQVYKALGTPPAYAKPNIGRHQWVTDAFCKYALPANAANAPEVAAIWYSDPDATAHAEGIGSAKAVESIQLVDAQFGRVIDTLKAKNLLNNYNIIISTDHGFVTEIGTETLLDFLVKEGIKKDKESDDVILAGGAVYLKDKSKENVEKIVSLLQKQEWIGAIFTAAAREGDMKGSVKGTLSFDAIHWSHKGRTPEILVDENWNDLPNQNNYKGSTLSKGIAGHGGSSPYEIHIPLIAYGPSFKRNSESQVATSNVDITPTVLYLQGIDVPESMDGRIMNELILKPSAATPAAKKEKLEASVTGAWGSYMLTLDRTLIGSRSYINFTKVSRTFNQGSLK